LVRIPVKIVLKLVRRLLVHLSHHIWIKAVHVRRRHPHCLAGADGHAGGRGTSDIIRARAGRRAEHHIFRIIGIWQQIGFATSKCNFF